MAASAVYQRNRHRIGWRYHLEVAGVTVRRAGVTFPSVVVSCVSRVAGGAVYQGQWWTNDRINPGIGAGSTMVWTQLAHAQRRKLRVYVGCWNLDRDQGSDVVAGSAVGERAQGEGAGVPFAVRARIGSCQDNQR